MKITIFNGSPKGKFSATNIMVEEFLADVKNNFKSFENIFLTEKNINTCKGCFSCWVKTPGKCIIKDDMEELLNKYISSDYVVFASPLYVDNVTGIMKKFFDRLIPLINPHIEEDFKGESIHRKRYEKYPKIIVISNCGFSEQSHFQVVSLMYKRISRNMHSKLIAEIYRGEGPLLVMDNETLHPYIDNYKRLLRKAGTELFEGNKISDKTMCELEKPIISHEVYKSIINQNWESRLLLKRREISD
ncbi:flavodoxin family protein [Clostridium sp. MSJ-11]|uniref:Flavodoxin family protein n=1 Tax=Clostridium mobile TaxID=2841512 RepID=A0ABS6EGH2_9CLOT|nr:flavodoxin family protein [Clostridium mobile]MBU5483806.1 flavodoxin family protein [Clostridium mobile]